MKALLIDSTRCVGCRGCQIACKEWNELPAEKTKFFAGKGYQNPRDLSPGTWTLITYNEVFVKGHFNWVFGKKQCFHCVDPACAAACPAHALHKTEAGPVIYDAYKCLGCRYCQLACPFLVPRFEWNKAIPEITKCTLCADRIQAGLEPACSKVCPTDAIVYGERDILVREAEDRIQANPRGYIHHIYGKDEAGGTCVMHISDVSFEDLGFQGNMPMHSVAALAEPAMGAIPFVMAGLGVGLGAISWVVNRRIQNEEHSEADTGGEA